MQWMLYGATGYTGQLVIEEALKRGHRPLLAGRNPDKLEALKQRYGLEYLAFRLDNISTIGEAIGDMDVVYHAAGPFIHTSDPMIKACLATSTHYLDITGEIQVFENTFSYHQAARANSIALISGVGFDVVPSDCLAAYVAGKVRGATSLEIAIIGLDNVSAGTAKSFIEGVRVGGRARRDGKLVKQAVGKLQKEISFGEMIFDTMSVPWGDVSTAYRTTGIPNITTFMEFPTAIRSTARFTTPILGLLTRSKAIRNALGILIDRFVIGPNDHALENDKAYIWAKATNDSGQAAEAWLEVNEVYKFTAQAGVRAVEKTIQLQPIGAITPAQAFGEDFVINIEGSSRYDVHS